MYDLVDDEERIDPYNLGPPYIDFLSDRDNTKSVFYDITRDEDDVGGVMRALTSLLERLDEKEKEWVRQTILDTRQFHGPDNVFHFTHDEQELELVMADVLGAVDKRVTRDSAKASKCRKINRAGRMAAQASVGTRKEIKEDESRSAMHINDEESDEEEVGTDTFICQQQQPLLVGMVTSIVLFLVRLTLRIKHIGCLLARMHELRTARIAESGYRYSMKLTALCAV